MTYELKMSTLFDWLVDVTGFAPEQVFRANQGNPEGPSDGGWVTYKIIGGMRAKHSQVAQTENETEPNEIDTKRINLGNTVVSINVYAENGEDILDDLYASRAEFLPRKILKESRLVLRDRSNVRNLARLSDTLWRARYQADFTFGSQHVRTEKNYKVNTVAIQGEINEVETTINA